MVAPNRGAVLMQMDQSGGDARIFGVGLSESDGTGKTRGRAAIRNGFLYDKGPILLADLNRQVGDETFLAFLRLCQTTLGWKFGSTKEIARLLQAAGRDFMPFFEKYYWGVEQGL